MFLAEELDLLKPMLQERLSKLGDFSDGFDSKMTDMEE